MRALRVVGAWSVVCVAACTGSVGGTPSDATSTSQTSGGGTVVSSDASSGAAGNGSGGAGGASGAGGLGGAPAGPTASSSGSGSSDPCAGQKDGDHCGGDL